MASRALSIRIRYVGTRLGLGNGFFGGRSSSIYFVFDLLSSKGERVGKGALHFLEPRRIRWHALHMRRARALHKLFGRGDLKGLEPRLFKGCVASVVWDEGHDFPRLYAEANIVGPFVEADALILHSYSEDV